ncbi:hypothetical protein [Rhizobium sp. CSW-27]|uniref:hypothetical protein n=1 Tax=Rhizobium sp. CSW-27 TaxID=2839985 RepID=UPI001C029937|nr:hypothetical protein [Rhizobium sp. CSW-27]MBT9369402.1 hypothetical protein [Rhizobium sp. CSW-27]
MDDKDNLDARAKMTGDDSRRFAEDSRERAEDALHAREDMTNHKAMQEAARLGGGDTYIVDSDLDDLDERIDSDQPDGRPSPMANGDNPER